MKKRPEVNIWDTPANAEAPAKTKVDVQAFTQAPMQALAQAQTDVPANTPLEAQSEIQTPVPINAQAETEAPTPALTELPTPTQSPSLAELKASVGVKRQKFIVGKKQRTIWMTHETIKQLDELCDKTGKSMFEIIQLAVGEIYKQVLKGE